MCFNVKGDVSKFCIFNSQSRSSFPRYRLIIRVRSTKPRARSMVKFRRSRSPGPPFQSPSPRAEIQIRNINNLYSETFHNIHINQKSSYSVSQKLALFKWNMGGGEIIFRVSIAERSSY
jgi:hypothetical protein